MSQDPQSLESIVDRMAADMVAKADRALEDAIKDHLGVGHVEPADLKGRLVRVSMRGLGHDVFCIDGLPILRVWYPTFSVREGHVSCEQRIERIPPFTDGPSVAQSAG